MSRMGVAGDLGELVLEEGDHVGGGEDSEMAKSPTAQDFADINEVCRWTCCHGDMYLALT